MASKEYWNAPDTGRKYLAHNSPIPIALLIAALIIYFLSHDIYVLGILTVFWLWTVLEYVRISRRVVSHPVCRLTDEFIILDYDRNVVPWNVITRVIWNPKEHEVKICHRTPRKPRDSTFGQRDHSVFIDGRWLKDQQVFIGDLGEACKEHSTEFVI